MTDMVSSVTHSDYYWKDYNERLHTQRQFRSTCAEVNSASTVHTLKQVLHNQDNLGLRRNLQKKCSITHEQDQYCQKIR